MAKKLCRFHQDKIQIRFEIVLIRKNIKHFQFTFFSCTGLTFLGLWTGGAQLWPYWYLKYKIKFLIKEQVFENKKQNNKQISAKKMNFGKKMIANFAFFENSNFHIFWYCIIQPNFALFSARMFLLANPGKWEPAYFQKTKQNEETHAKMCIFRCLTKKQCADNKKMKQNKKC